MKLLLVGNGGHCRSILDTVLSMNVYSQIGIVSEDKNDEIPKIDTVIHAGTDDDLPMLLRNGYAQAFVAVGSIGDTSIRRKIADNLLKIGFEIPNLIDPTAAVSKTAKLGQGIFIGKNVSINTGAVIGDFAIINTGAIIEHDCIVQDFVHISPGSVICGGAAIGNDSHIGANSTVKQYIEIGDHAIIGMGSNIINSIAADCIVYCNTCKVSN